MRSRHGNHPTSCPSYLVALSDDVRVRFCECVHLFIQENCLWRVALRVAFRSVSCRALRMPKHATSLRCDSRPSEQFLTAGQGQGYGWGSASSAFFLSLKLKLLVDTHVHLPIPCLRILLPPLPDFGLVQSEHTTLQCRPQNRGDGDKKEYRTE